MFIYRSVTNRCSPTYLRGLGFTFLAALVGLLHVVLRLSTASSSPVPWAHRDETHAQPCRGPIGVGRPAASLPWMRVPEPYAASFDTCAAKRPAGGIWLTYDNLLSRDGAGSQVQRILGTFLVAASLNFGYIHSPISEIGYQGLQALEQGGGDVSIVSRWNAAINLSTSNGVLCKGFEAERSNLNDVVGSDGCRHVYIIKPSYTDLEMLARVNCSDTPLVVHMLHGSGVLDEQPKRGRHPSLFFPNFLPWLRVGPQTERLRVAVHVRRGELFVVDSDRMLPNSYYVTVCKTLSSIFDQLGFSYVFEIYTEQASKKIKVVNSDHGIGGRLAAPIIIDPKDSHLEDFNVLSPREMFVNIDALDSFQRMATAHVLIMSRSSFSHAAATLIDITRGIVIYYPFWHAPLPGWTVLHPDVQPGTIHSELMLRTRGQLAAAISRVFLPLPCFSPSRVVHVVALGASYVLQARSSSYSEAILRLNPGYELNVVDETAGLRLLQDKFPEYVGLYNSLPHVAWRSDLIRYILMYVHGGVYIDLDLQPLIGFDALMRRVQAPLPAAPTHSVFCIGARAVLPYEGANGFIIAPANDSIFLTLAAGMRDILNSSDYGASVKTFFSILAARFHGIQSYKVIDGTYFLQEVEVQRVGNGPSYTINVQADEIVMLSNGWVGTSWPEK